MLSQDNIPIFLSESPNRHLLIWGQSGQGKSYFMTQKIEEEYKLGRKILIIDYSGSYTENELNKADFQYFEQVLVLNLFNAPIHWISNAKNISLFLQESKDMLVHVLNICSYNQSQLILQALELLWKENQQTCFSWSIPLLIKSLKNLKKTCNGEDTNSDRLQNIERLLSRLMKLETLSNFIVSMQSGSLKERRKKIVIFQLSDLPEEHRQFLTSVLSELLWYETKRGSKSLNYFDTIFYDEFQFLSIKGGSALSHFMRESRKYNVGLTLATQFISHYDKEEQETLLQAGNILIFKPTPTDLTFSAKVIDPNSPCIWKKILSELTIGSAVLAGNYLINKKSTLITKPIVCHVTKKEENHEKNSTIC